MKNAKKEAAFAVIDQKADLIVDVADQIWGFAELSLQEVQSAALYEKVLEEEGFRVEKGICSIPTAFAASFGSGKPHIGILAASGFPTPACASPPKQPANASAYFPVAIPAKPRYTMSEI